MTKTWTSTWIHDEKLRFDGVEVGTGHEDEFGPGKWLRYETGQGLGSRL